MNEKPSAWTPEEKSALFAAVEQFRATGGQLDWHAIAATVPARSAKAAQTLYYQLFAAHTLVRIRAPAAPAFPPPACFGARACGAVARLTPWIESGIGSAVRATDRSLRLARSSPDPHPPRSRMRCDGLVRSARSRLISRACSSASGFCARRPGRTLHRPQRLPAGDGASACLCLRVVSDARKQPAQLAGPRRAVPSRRSWRQPLLLDRDLSNNSRLPSFCE
jgi:hypothetical protein